MADKLDNIEIARYYIGQKQHIVTISEYSDWLKEKNQEAIAIFLYYRLHSRDDGQLLPAH
jgi:hypothetical protein